MRHRVGVVEAQRIVGGLDGVGPRPPGVKGARQHRVQLVVGRVQAPSLGQLTDRLVGVTGFKEDGGVLDARIDEARIDLKGCLVGDEALVLIADQLPGLTKVEGSFRVCRIVG